MKAMSRALNFIKYFFYFILGNIFAVFFYDRKYLRGRYFEGKVYGICSIGWKWATLDGLARILLGSNRKVPWPVSYKVSVTHPKNIIFDINDMHIFHTFGTYFQGIDAKIYIGKGSYIAPNVGLITANHDLNSLDKHTIGENIVLGENNWIGMNSVILPGITLGNNTIVGAGSVVTKSFPEGNCVIGGNPAKLIKYLDEQGKNHL
jgi:acetyltransferase-like isoleucine patch superfamily enzyme